jgi:hypothetical protein
MLLSLSARMKLCRCAPIIGQMACCSLGVEAEGEGTPREGMEEMTGKFFPNLLFVTWITSLFQHTAGEYEP